MSPSALTLPESTKTSCAGDNGLGVLVVDEEIPFPLYTGKRIRTYNLLKHLAEKHRIKFLCHRSVDAGEQREAEAEFDSFGIETIFLDRALPKQTLLTPPHVLAAQLGRNLFSRFPFLVQKHCSRELFQQVHRLASAIDIDLVHFEWTPYAATALAGLPKPWAVAAHNVESLIWQRYWETEQNPVKRRYIRHQCHKFKRFESEVFSKANKTVVVSTPDAELAKKEFAAANVAVVENGVDLDFFADTRSIRNPHEVLFLGSLDWRPNLDAVEVLLDRVFPEVRHGAPDATLTIVGRKPPAWLADRVSQAPSVTLHSDVPDVRPYLTRCGLMAVPLRIGGGSRLKILEAAAARTPVVSTTIGAEGLEFAAGRHYFGADGVDEMATVIVQVLNNPEASVELTNSAYDAAAEQYAWSSIAGRQDRAWRETHHHAA